MNKYQEALEYMLELERLYWDDSGLVADQRFIDNFELLQELVDKATPMKPIHIENGRYLCANCSMSFTIPKVKLVSNRYCDVCGQKLDWSEDE